MGEALSPRDVNFLFQEVDSVVGQVIYETMQWARLNTPQNSLLLTPWFQVDQAMFLIQTNLASLACRMPEGRLGRKHKHFSDQKTCFPIQKVDIWAAPSQSTVSMLAVSLPSQVQTVPENNTSKELDWRQQYICQQSIFCWIATMTPSASFCT